MILELRYSTLYQAACTLASIAANTQSLQVARFVTSTFGKRYDVVNF